MIRFLARTRFVAAVLAVLASASVGAQSAPEVDPEAPWETVVRADWLGRSEQALREEFGSSLQAEPIERPQETLAVVRPSTPDAAIERTDPVVENREASASDSKSPFGDQQRLVQKISAGDVRRVEYELFEKRVYRIRWQLAERFERPLIEDLVEHLTPRLGKPYYDQTIEGKFGTGRATFRRTAWRRGNRNLEIRQLNPLVGGPIYLTLSDLEAIRTIVSSGGTAAPEPDSIGRWWTKPIRAPEPIGAAEKTALLEAVRGMPVWEDWGSGPRE